MMLTIAAVFERRQVPRQRQRIIRVAYLAWLLGATAMLFNWVLITVM